MERQPGVSYMQWLQAKDTNRNLISAFFQMLCITLISTSLVQLSWFQITGGLCVPHLSVFTFFTFGYSEPVKASKSFNIYRNQEFGRPQFSIDYEMFDESAYRCITPRIVNMMRMIILFSFMAIIFSLIGFFLDIIGSKSKVYDFVRRNALPSSCTVMWILAIITLSCSIQSLIEDSFRDVYPDIEIKVNFEYGFYTACAAGLMALAATASNLVCTYIPRSQDNMDQRLLPHNWEDESFSLPPPPPYSAPPPPPPYTP